MYTFELSDKFLTEREQEVFEDHLAYYGLDNRIWAVFSSLFKSGFKHTEPLLLRVFKDSQIFGAIIITKCSRYGRALFDNRFLSWIMNQLSVPYYQWIKFGCCMDMMSNPRFVKDPELSEEVFKAALHYLKTHSTLTIVTDHSENSGLYNKAAILPSLPHALIDCSNMTSIHDYLKGFKNLKRKIRVFEIKGGDYIRIEQNLDDEQLTFLRKCFLATAEKSVFYLPYQDLYLNAAINTSKTQIENVVYFIATLDGEFLGYQAAIKTGQYLNALHGAFDRNRKTTFHAYDILFVKMTEYAIEQGLQIIDFGAVLNYTKQKMVNKTINISYFLMSKYSVTQWFYERLLKFTKIQGSHQLKFVETF